MTLQTILPFGEQGSVKNLVFSILSKEYPLKLIDLTNFIRKRYGRSVTFQAVRKATLQLVDEGVLLREENEFRINPEWVLRTKHTLDALHAELQQRKRPAHIDSVGGDVSVFTFDSLAKMMQFWQELVDDWYHKFKSGDPNLNCYQGSHLWEGILYPDSERRVMEQLKRKGIKSYAVFTSNTPLDRSAAKFYKSIGIRMQIAPSQSAFDHAYYVATYGELVVQTQFPPGLVKELDAFFKKTKRIEDLDVTELAEIANRRRETKLTVIRNLSMAQQINKSILSQMT